MEENKLFLVTFQLVLSNDANCLSRLFNVREHLHIGGKEDVPGHFQLVFGNDANCLFGIFNARTHHLQSPHWKKNRLFLVTFQLVFSNDANCLSGIFNVREHLHIGGKQDVPGH